MATKIILSINSLSNKYVLSAYDKTGQFQVMILQKLKSQAIFCPNLTL